MSIFWPKMNDMFLSFKLNKVQCQKKKNIEKEMYKGTVLFTKETQQISSHADSHV